MFINIFYNASHQKTTVNCVFPAIEAKNYYTELLRKCKQFCQLIFKKIFSKASNFFMPFFFAEQFQLYFYVHSTDQYLLPPNLLDLSQPPQHVDRVRLIQTALAAPTYP